MRLHDSQYDPNDIGTIGWLEYQMNRRMHRMYLYKYMIEEDQ